MNGVGIIDTARLKLLQGLSTSAPLTQERAAELKEAAEEAGSAIDAYLAGIDVIADYLFMCQDNPQADCQFNEASWLLKTLSRSIDGMRTLQDDCDMYLNAKPEKKAGKAVRS